MEPFGALWSPMGYELTHTYSNMHTYMHTYIHACIHACVCPQPFLPALAVYWGLRLQQLTMATQALDEVYEAEQSEQSEQDLAEVDQTGAGQEGEESADMEESYNESLNEDNESLNEDIAVDCGSSTKTEDGSNAISESNCQKGKCIVAVAQVMLPGDATSIVADCLADPLKP